MALSKKDYYAALCETSTAVWPLLDGCFYGKVPENILPELRPHIDLCLQKRRDKPLLRPLLTRMCVESTTLKPWTDFAPVLAAVEMLNISTYQSNYCFDEKAGVTTSSAKNNQFISSMLTLSAATALIDSCRHMSDAAKTRTLTLLARSNHEVYLGQFSDLNILNLARVDQYNESSFTGEYLMRCDLIAGSTFRACSAGAIATEASDEAITCLQDYLGALGAATQVINDLGDYIPHTTKDYAVPYSDLVLGRLTFPTYLLYKGGYPIDEWRRLLAEHSHRTDEVVCAVTRAITELQIEPQTRAFVKKHHFPIIRKSLKRLRRLLGSEKSSVFDFASTFIYDSKMLRYFRKDADRAWPQTKE